MPRYKQNLLARDPDYKYAKIIGHNNDAMFGESRNYGWASECYQVDHDFDTEPLELFVEDGYIGAKNTKTITEKIIAGQCLSSLKKQFNIMSAK